MCSVFNLSNDSLHWNISQISRPYKIKFSLYLFSLVGSSDTSSDEEDEPPVKKLPPTPAAKSQDSSSESGELLWALLHE